MGMLATGSSAIMFPMPMRVHYDTLGLPREDAKNLGRNIFGSKSNGMVDTVTAYRFMQRAKFGADIHSDSYRRIFEATHHVFFDGIPFDGREGILTPREIMLNVPGFADGDTVKILKFLSPGGWKNYKVSLRNDGIDTPESNPSGKLNKVVEGITKYLMAEYKPTSISQREIYNLVKPRVVYLGKLSAALAIGFGHWIDDNDLGLRVGPAYNLATTDPDLCFKLDLADKYGRFLGRIFAGRNGDGKDHIVDFVGNALPAVMATLGQQAFGDYKRKVGLHGAALLSMGKDSELADLLSVRSAVKPTEAFSAANCDMMAGIWKMFSDQYPAVMNDFQTMQALLGTAHPYPKYKGHMTFLDLAAEQYALGTTAFSSGHGLTLDPFMMLMRPSSDTDDPFHSPVYAMFEDFMTGGRDLNPPDCTLSGSCQV